MTRVSDPVRPDATRRPDYEALAHRDGPVPESAAWNILSYLLAGLIGFGLPAWFLDRWLGTTWIVLIGILLGTAVAMMTIWFRYGTGETSRTDGSSVRGATSSPDSVSGSTRTGSDPGPQVPAPEKSAPQHAAPTPDAIPLEDTP